MKKRMQPNDSTDTAEGRSSAEAFTRGKDLAITLMAAIAHDPSAEYEAQHRPNGGPQNVGPFIGALRQLETDEAALEGFAAVMTGVLSLGFAGFGLSLDDVRRLVRTDRMGEADAVHSGETNEAAAPSTNADAGRSTSFIEGVHVFAELLRDIYKANSSGKTWIEAEARIGEFTDENCKLIPGVTVVRVPQYRQPVVDQLTELQEDRSKLEGFAAAMVGFIGPTAHSSWGDDPGDYFRSLSYEQIEGGESDAAFQTFLRSLDIGRGQ